MGSVVGRDVFSGEMVRGEIYTHTQFTDFNLHYSNRVTNAQRQKNKQTGKTFSRIFLSTTFVKIMETKRLITCSHSVKSKLKQKQKSRSH